MIGKIEIWKGGKKESEKRLEAEETEEHEQRFKDMQNEKSYGENLKKHYINIFVYFIPFRFSLQILYSPFRAYISEYFDQNSSK